MLLLTKADRKSLRRIPGHADRNRFLFFFFLFQQPETAFSAPFVNAAGFIVTQIRLCARGNYARTLEERFWLQ